MRLTLKKINEALDDHLADKASEYYHLWDLDDETRDKVDTALPHGHTIIDLNHGAGIHEPDPDVRRHLESNGYHIKDYKAGIASTTKVVGNPEKGIPMQRKTVDESIGKVLNKTKAPDHIKQYYENDPARGSVSATSGSGLKILISHRPEATVLKTSNSPWSGESCMNATTGINRNYLSADSEHGTHEAFLIHHDDATAHLGYPHSPIARISLKRHVNQDDETDSVYRPEERGYGKDSSAFHRTVQHWAEHNYPATEGSTYEKHGDLYHDSGDQEFTALGDHDIKEGVKTNKSGHTSHVNFGTLSADHQKLFTDETIKAHPDKIPSNVIDRLKNTDLQAHHIDKLIDQSQNPNDAAWHFAHSSNATKISRNALERARIASKSVGLPFPRNALGNKKLPDEVIDELPSSQLERIPDEKLKPHHLDKIVNSYVNGESGSAYPLREKGHLLSGGQITKVINHMPDDVPAQVLSNKNFTMEHAKQVDFSNGGIVHARHVPYSAIRDHKAATAALSNPHLDDMTKKHAVHELVLHAENHEPSFGQYKFGALKGAIPTGSSKHFTDEHVERLADTGYNKPIGDLDLSNRLIHAHLNAAHEAAKSMKEKFHTPEHGWEDSEGTDFHDRPGVDDAKEEVEKHLWRASEQHINSVIQHGPDTAMHPNDFQQHISKALKPISEPSGSYHYKHDVSKHLYHPGDNSDGQDSHGWAYDQAVDLYHNNQ
jgi:hypothetical protein